LRNAWLWLRDCRRTSLGLQLQEKEVPPPTFRASLLCFSPFFPFTPTLFLHQRKRPVFPRKTSRRFPFMIVLPVPGQCPPSTEFAARWMVYFFQSGERVGRLFSFTEDLPYVFPFEGFQPPLSDPLQPASFFTDPRASYFLRKESSPFPF